jgi:hypothetical protein
MQSSYWSAIRSCFDIRQIGRPKNPRMGGSSKA